MISRQNSFGTEGNTSRNLQLHVFCQRTLTAKFAAHCTEARRLCVSNSSRCNLFYCSFVHAVLWKTRTDAQANTAPTWALVARSVEADPTITHRGRFSELSGTACWRLAVT